MQLLKAVAKRKPKIELRLILKVYSPKEPAGLIKDPEKVFLSYIPAFYQGHI